MEKPIVWSKTSLKQLQKIYFYLLEETKSLNIANKVIDEIFNSVTNLSKNSDIYERDEMKFNNDGSFRAYEISSYRISYKINDKDILIVRIMHAARNPKLF